MLANSNAGEDTGQRPPATPDDLNELLVLNERQPVSLAGASPGAPAGEGVHTVVRPAMVTRALFIREYGQDVAPFLSGAHGVLMYQDKRQPVAAANRTPWYDAQRVARQAPVGSWDDGAVIGQELSGLA